MHQPAVASAIDQNGALACKEDADLESHLQTLSSDPRTNLSICIKRAQTRATEDGHVLVEQRALLLCHARPTVTKSGLTALLSLSSCMYGLDEKAGAIPS